jgi:two-component system cell cycle sensor histidine kinase/response regulator CckA
VADALTLLAYIAAALLLWANHRRRERRDVSLLVVIVFGLGLVQASSTRLPLLLHHAMLAGLGVAILWAAVRQKSQHAKEPDKPALPPKIDSTQSNPEESNTLIDAGPSLPPANVEETHTRQDGEKVAVLASRVPLRDVSGAVVGVLGVYQDVTDRKRLEEQLRQAQKMEAIGRLAGGIAHDFNNLLTIIVGNTHLLRELPPGAVDAPQLIDDIHDAADRAAALTRQLLTFSRRHPSRPEVVDLSEIVGGLAGLLRRLLGERISVRTQLASDPIRVRADRGQLEQVVMNLAVNARDAMPGGGTLTIMTSSVTTPAGPGSLVTRIARLTMSDSGVGMTDEVKARIFEPFFTTKDPSKGTGLGLATVYGIVEQAGGHIEVESAPGAGTTFRIGLPWCESLPRPSAILQQRNPLRGTSGQGRRVLLAEDEEGIRKLSRFTLEGQGYFVMEAEDAETAFGMISPDQPIDLLVTDLIMPGMDGRELATRVRGIHADIGVVFISGYVPDAHRLDGIPGALFLPKPFNPGDLVRMAERAVRRSLAAKETMSGPAGEKTYAGEA